MLEISHVTKFYGKNPACRDVSFTLDDGTVTVLLGPNGAGKSTIIKSVIGFLKYDGSVQVNGMPNKSVGARRVLGYIPELPSLYPNLTVSEHMEFLARAYKLTDYKARIDDLFTRFELNDHRKKFGDELSKGMQQKLNICLGLLPEPEIILLGLSDSASIKAAQDIGLPEAREVFADRAYMPDGSLMPRTMEGAVIHDETLAIERVVRMVKEHKVTAADGNVI